MIKSKDLVSVILPTYNRAHLIDRAIKSVLNQTYHNFEIIVVDDGSSDATKSVVNLFKDKRLKYIKYHQNRGACFAWNAGIKESQAKYIAFQDSDDEWLPTKLEKHLESFEVVSSKVGVVYTDMWRIHKDGKKEYVNTPRIMPEEKIIYNDALNFRFISLGIVSAMIRRECFTKVGFFDERFTRHMDVELFIRISKFYYFYHIAEPLMRCFVTDPSMSSDGGALILSHKLLLKKYFEDIKKDQKLLQKYLYWIGTLSCQLGYMSEGRKYILKAFKIRCLNIKFLFAYIISFFGKKIYKRLVELKNKSVILKNEK